jgi:hypothetical protein
LPEISLPIFTDIYDAGIFAMGLGERLREAVLSSRHGGKMNVVSHQAVSQYAKAVPVRFPLEELEIEGSVAFRKKDLLPPVASLDDMMGISGNNHAGNSGHGQSLLILFVSQGINEAEDLASHPSREIRK